MSATPTKTIVSADFACGFLIIDAADFDPVIHHECPVDPPADSAPRPDDVAAMTVADLKDALTRRGIAFKANTSKADLLDLLSTTE